jgi:hypothetical protein
MEFIEVQHVAIIEVPFEMAVADHGVDFLKSITNRCQGLPCQIGIPSADIRIVGMRTGQRTLPPQEAWQLNPF